MKTAISAMKKPFLLYIAFSLLFTFHVSCKKDAPKHDDGHKPPVSYTLDDVFSNANPQGNLKCLIVYKDGQMLKAKYFGPGDSLMPHDVRSVTKSVMATLIGIAIDKGFILSETQKIKDFLVPFVGTMDDAKANISIGDILMMCSGLSGDELTNPSEYFNWRAADDQLSFTLNKPMAMQPGNTFYYSTGASHLASAVLTQATGMSTLQFARQYLFQPLGIEDHNWETDNRGLYNGGAGLCLTPQDMLKIGELYLNKGICNGTRIVSEEWINKATTFKISTRNMQPFGPGYGYFWWLGNINLHPYYFANGYGGQFIVVVPDLKIIVVATNAWSGVQTSTANTQWYSTLQMIIEKIIPLYD